ncbi:hypothetical protein QAD02_010439 [Eretmocerus hayati]|uniref:Uncharacterized protein n=1 Tax=Eretmocerus hayati TaxID=131215 RepID=A0ACC2NUW2_9HYME|nr:hypothetical protein QAD02_010439 [Eretmocerus hayati]
MKTSAQHPLILATTRRVELSANDQHQKASEPVIRLKLDKPKHWEWQLTTSADDLPLIQLLDRDGRLLVETTGRVAQRARGSFREGLRSHESFPDVPASPSSPVPRVSQGNRNYDGFSSKFDPRRRSSSEISVSSASTSASRLGRKRHSAHAGSLIAECDENVQAQADELAEDGNKTLTKESLDGIRRFLRDQIQLKMEREKLVTRSSSLPQNHEKFDCSDKTEVALSKEQESFRFRNDAISKSGPDSIERCKAAIDKNEIQRVSKKHLPTNGKRRAYKKSKSDRNLESSWDEACVDSDCSHPIKNNYPTRRVRSQEFCERSWREYKQRKRHEKLLKNSPSDRMIEEDCDSKLRWKDPQVTANRVNNCRVCENMTSCDAGYAKEKTRKNYCCSLQENYMSIVPTCSDALYEINEIYSDKDAIDSPDFGYNSIPKQRSRNISANSSVKKADTLKIFCESGCSKTDSDEICYDYSNKTNEDITRDYFKRVNHLLAWRNGEIWIRTKCQINEVDDDEFFPDYVQQENSTKKRRLRKKTHKLSKGNEDGTMRYLFHI